MLGGLLFLRVMVDSHPYTLPPSGCTLIPSASLLVYNPSSLHFNYMLLYEAKASAFEEDATVSKG